MELVFLWLICGLIAGIIGSNKGGGGCGWFFIGCILGPLGVILALVIKPDAKEVERQALKSGDTKKCPYCAELIKAEAIKCRHCGSALEGA